VTTLLLIRHAACAQMSERLYGRKVSAPLSEAGRDQARVLAETLFREKLDAVFSSPRERARDTAAAIAAPHRLVVEVDETLDEVDFGAWAGLTFRELERDPRWRAWNRDRERHAPPGGESILAVQHRVLGTLRKLARTRVGERIALVTHAEVIRSAVLFLRGWSPNRHDEVEVPPASVTTVLGNGAVLPLALSDTLTHARSAP
jgi:ribonuclease H / adenosylcobalamin/alpha-ribazole phosphatase